MREIRILIRSNKGDVIGHLVRAVQMLGSYGKEWELAHIGDVRLCTDSPLCVEAVLTGRTSTTPEGWSRIEKEVLWSLNSEEGDHAPLYIEQLHPDRQEQSGSVVLPAWEFQAMCDWGHTEGLTPPGGGGEARPSL